MANRLIYNVQVSALSGQFIGVSLRERLPCCVLSFCITTMRSTWLLFIFNSPTKRKQLWTSKKRKAYLVTLSSRKLLFISLGRIFHIAFSHLKIEWTVINIPDTDIRLFPQKINFASKQTAGSTANCSKSRSV